MLSKRLDHLPIRYENSPCFQPGKALKRVLGLYSSSITSVADANGTLYTNLGWGCLINFFYVVCTHTQLIVRQKLTRI